MGAGQCGTLLLAQILDKQHDARVSHEQPPLLPWNRRPGAPGIRERLQRLLATHKTRLVGDVASFYLPYAEEAIAFDPHIRIVGLRRPREEVVASFCRVLDQSARFPINHWAEQPAPGWYHDPIWTRVFPQYDTTDREEGLRRYWDEYYQRAEELVRRFPDNVRLWDTDALTSEKGVREVLSFVGIPHDQQVIVTGQRNATPESAVGVQAGSTLTEGDRHLAATISPEFCAAGLGASPLFQHAGRQTHPLDPRKCVVLVPFIGFIHQECEDALKELERRGYSVRRVGGYAAIDQGRNQMATDALLDGFEETLWIDADVGFHPDSVERLRSHPHPIVCGVYPQKGKRALACHIMPGTPSMVFGRHGGLVEMLYAGAGFLLVRREVYLTIQHRLQLPVCNERFGHPTIPFFLPLTQRIEDGYWYLAEDYAFCQRAHDCGYRIYADTTIRLWHIGNYRYGWEDAGLERQRFGAFTLNFGQAPGTPRATATDRPPALANFAAQYPWPERPPEIPQPDAGDGLSPAARELLGRTVSPNVKLIVELGCGAGRVTRGLATLAAQASIIAIDTWPGDAPLSPTLSPEYRGEAAMSADAALSQKYRSEGARSPTPADAPLSPTLSPECRGEGAMSADSALSQEYRDEGAGLAQAASRFDAFLSRCWDIRQRVIPLRAAGMVEALQRVAEAGLEPELVYLAGDAAADETQRQLTCVLDLFPQAVVVGDQAQREDVRRALESIARARHIHCQGYGPAWRFLPPPPATSDVAQPLQAARGDLLGTQDRMG
jgi:hypothetical protein